MTRALATTLVMFALAVAPWLVLASYVAGRP